MNSKGTEIPIISIPLTDYNLINRIIPSFDGNTKNLNYYIRCIESVLSAHNLGPDDKTLICIIRAKLSGKALEALSREVDIENWISVKNALTSRFGEQRTEIQLLQELMKCTKSRNESCDNFGRRIRELLDALCEIGTNGDSRYYQTLAVNTFIDSLDYYLGLGIRVKQPSTLEAAVSYARQEEARLRAHNAVPTTSRNNEIVKTQYNYQNIPRNNQTFPRYNNYRPGDHRNSQQKQHQPAIMQNREVVPIKKEPFNNKMYPIDSCVNIEEQTPQDVSDVYFHSLCEVDTTPSTENNIRSTPENYDINESNFLENPPHPDII